MITIDSTLFSKIKYYRKLREKLLEHLSKHPNDWLKFQEIFNAHVNEIYNDILNFERENISKSETEIYKFKKIFEKRYRNYFLYGEYIKWSFEKPFGYAGDFKIIDDIYQNQPRTIGFDRLWDNYFQQLAASKAVRERKEDFKEIILSFIKERGNQNIRIMNLGSGPAREIKEMLENDSEKILSGITFDCYDFDIRAINYAKKLLDGGNNVNFFQKNAVRLALKKDIKNEILSEYDLIYSTGLFDYLDGTITSRLLNNLRKVLKEGGVIAISNAGDKYNNPSAVWMEWVADWYLVYKTEIELKEIFLNAGFSAKNLQITPQHSSEIMLYCIASKEH